MRWYLRYQLIRTLTYPLNCIIESRNFSLFSGGGTRALWTRFTYIDHIFTWGAKSHKFRFAPYLLRTASQKNMLEGDQQKIKMETKPLLQNLTIKSLLVQCLQNTKGFDIPWQMALRRLPSELEIIRVRPAIFPTIKLMFDEGAISRIIKRVWAIIHPSPCIQITLTTALCFTPGFNNNLSSPSHDIQNRCEHYQSIYSSLSHEPNRGRLVG